MAGRMLTRLASDFLCTITDRGETIVLKNKASQTLNISSGDYSTVENQVTLTDAAVVSQIDNRDLELNPHKFQVGDRLMRFREADLSGYVCVIDDEIEYDSETYKVIDTRLTDGIYQVLARKSES